MLGVAGIPDTGWRLPDDACALLSRLVADHRPALVVECGSGRSTVALAEAAAEYGSRVVALEHDFAYVESTIQLLHDTNTDAEVRYAQLVDGWYDRAQWDDLAGIGLLLVDGPPGHAGRHNRAPAVPLLRDRMLPDCVVVLDDVDRDDEREAWESWGITDTTLVRHAKATLAYGTAP